MKEWILLFYHTLYVSKVKVNSFAYIRSTKYEEYLFAAMNRHKKSYSLLDKRGKINRLAVFTAGTSPLTFTFSLYASKKY